MLQKIITNVTCDITCVPNVNVLTNINCVTKKMMKYTHLMIEMRVDCMLLIKWKIFVTQWEHYCSIADFAISWLYIT